MLDKISEAILFLIASAALTSVGTWILYNLWALHLWVDGLQLMSLGLVAVILLGTGWAAAFAGVSNLRKVFKKRGN